MREGNALQVFYDEKLVGINETLTTAKEANWLYEKFGEGVYADIPGLCKIADRAEIEEKGLKMVFRSVRFHFPLKSRFLYRQKIILTDYLEYLQIVCRIIGGDCCWIVCYVHISRIRIN